MPKTLEDFPQFLVDTVRGGEASADGYRRYQINGKFNRIIEGIDPHWFWLLFGEKDCICATLQSLDKDTKAAVLTCDEINEPKVVGQSLAYLNPYWQAYHVWMVLDPGWGWNRKQFHGVDAYAQDYDSEQTSIVNGREVRVWTKLEPAIGRVGSSRHYPATDQSLPPNTERRLVPSGWGHEHCDLCRAHIDSQQSGYCDSTDQWVCEKCYERYVLPRDLAFVDEL